MTQVSKPRTKRAPVVKAAAPKAVAPVAAAPEPVVAAASVVAEPAPVSEIAETISQTIEVLPETIEAVVEAVIPPVTPALIEEIPMDTIKTASAKAQTLFTEMNARAKSAMEKSTKVFEEATEFNKANVEAVVESAKIAAKGFETMGQDVAEYGRKSFENATAAMKSLSSIKSPTDFFKLQSDFVRGAFDAMVAESSRSTEAMLKLAGEVAQPISNRAAVAVEKVKLAA